MVTHLFGEEFEAAESKFEEEHKDNPQLITEVRTLMNLLSKWHVSVFWNLREQIKEDQVKEIEQHLDKRFLL